MGKVYKKVVDANKITATERQSLTYCLAAFNWTDAAQHWIVDAIDKWDQAHVEKEEPPAKKPRTERASYYMTIDGMKCDRAIVDTCAKSVEGQGDGRVSVDDAKKVWEKAADGGKVTKAERWTVRHCLTHFKFTEPAMDFIKENLQKAVEADK